MGNDPFPYGVKRNTKVLDAVATFSHEQSLSSRKVNVEEIFYPTTLDT
jgi:4,5-dihydroxyphthalate decarboxylase